MRVVVSGEFEVLGQSLVQIIIVRLEGKGREIVLTVTI